METDYFEKEKPSCQQKPISNSALRDATAHSQTVEWLQELLKYTS